MKRDGVATALSALCHCDCIVCARALAYFGEARIEGESRHWYIKLVWNRFQISTDFWSLVCFSN